MENTKEILDDISSMYDEYEKLEKRMRTKLPEYCEVLNEKYKDRIGKKITTVKTEYHDYYGGFTFFGGFTTDYIGHLVIVPILYYPTKKVCLQQDVQWLFLVILMWLLKNWMRKHSLARYLHMN